MRHLLPLLMILFAVHTAVAQGHSLSFMSQSDAKFYVYLNGRLQNQRSSGHVTLNGLEEKDYHIRIVIDDPFQVAATKTIRPNGKNPEYSVEFNVVRERVYIRETRPDKEQPRREETAEESVTVDVGDAAPAKPAPRPNLRRDPLNDTTPLPHINTLKTPVEI